MGKYELRESVGEGKYSRIHKAIDNEGVEVAVKIGKSGSYFSVQTEIDVLSALSNEHIVNLIDFSLIKNAMVFPLYNKTIAQMMEHLEISDAVKYMSEIAAGVEYLHHSSDEWFVIHRDIKPANLMVSFDNKAILIDFGFAVKLHEEKKLRECGSPVYMSPEIFLKKPIGRSSDVYSFAVTMFQVFSKQKDIHTQFRGLPELRKFILEGDRWEIPDSIPGCLKKLIELSWLDSSEERFDIKQIKEILINYLSTISISK